jgi:hypothetical protein
MERLGENTVPYRTALSQTEQRKHEKNERKTRPSSRKIYMVKKKVHIWAFLKVDWKNIATADQLSGATSLGWESGPDYGRRQVKIVFASIHYPVLLLPSCSSSQDLCGLQRLNNNFEQVR